MSGSSYTHPILKQYQYSVLKIAHNRSDSSEEVIGPSWETSKVTNIGLLIGSEASWKLKLADKKLSHPDWCGIQAALHHLSYCLENNVGNPDQNWIDDLRKITNGALQFSALKRITGASLEEVTETAWARFVKC